MPLALVIGNKNYSSSSMRPWVLMQEWMAAARLETFVAADEPYADKP